MGITEPRSEEAVGCVGWVIGGIVLIIAGVAAIFVGLVDGLF